MDLTTDVSKGVVNPVAEQSNVVLREESCQVVGQQGIALKPRIGLWTGISIIVGSIIGTGIFISPKGVLKNTKSIGLSLIVWAIGGIISLLGALTFAEIGVLLPLSGGEYVYTIEAFKRFQSKLSGLPGFLYIWVSVGLWHPAFLCIFSRVFAQYILALFHSDCHTTEEGPYYHQQAIYLLSTIVIMAVTFVNCWSVRLTTSLLNVFGLLKVLSLIFIIILGTIHISHGHIDNFKDSFENTSMNAGDWAAAVINSLFAYSGWSQLNYVIEEIKHPERNLPRCILMSLLIVTTIYLLTNVAYFSALSAEELLGTEVVAVAFAEKVASSLASVMPILVACSALGTAMGNSFAASRISYAAGKKEHMWELMSYASVTRKTLMLGVLLNGILSLLFLYIEDIQLLIEFSVVLQYIFYITTVVALLLLKRDWVHDKPDFRLHAAVPIAYLVVCLVIVFTTVIGSFNIAYLYGLIYIVLGAAVYVIFYYFNFTFPFKGIITVYVQLALLCGPTKDPELKL